MKLKFFLILLIILFILFLFFRNKNIFENFSNIKQNTKYDISGYYSINLDSIEKNLVSINKVATNKFLIIYNNIYGSIYVTYGNNSHEINILWFNSNNNYIKNGFKNGKGYIYKSGNEFIINSVLPKIIFKKKKYKPDFDNILGEYYGEEGFYINIMKGNSENKILNLVCRLKQNNKKNYNLKGFLVIGDTIQSKTFSHETYINSEKGESENINNKSYDIYLYLNKDISGDYVIHRGKLENIGNHYKIITDKLGNCTQNKKIIISNEKRTEELLDIKRDYNSLSSCLNRNNILINNKTYLTSIRDKRYNCNYTDKSILNKIKNTIMYFPVENNTIFNKIVGDRNAIGILLKNSDFNLIKDDLISPNFIDIYDKSSKYPMCTLLPCNNEGDTCTIKSENFSKVGILKDKSIDSVFVIKAINDVCNINHKKYNKFKRDTNFRISNGKFTEDKMNCNQICLNENANCTEARLYGEQQVSCNITPKNGELIKCKCLRKRKNINLELIEQDNNNKKTCRKVCLSKGLTCSNLVEIETNSHRFKQCNIRPNSNNTHCICHNSGEKIDSINIIRSDINKKIDRSKITNIIKEINPDEYISKVVINEGFRDICDGKYIYLKIDEPKKEWTPNADSYDNTKNSCNHSCSRDENCDAWTFNPDTQKCLHYEYNISTGPHKYRCKSDGPFFQGEQYGKVKKINNIPRRKQANYQIKPVCKAINNSTSEWKNSYEISGINSNVWGNLRDTHFFKGDTSNTEAKWIWTSSHDVVTEVTFKYNYCSYKPHQNATLYICIDNTGSFKINNSAKISTSGGWSGGTGNIYNIILKEGLNNIKVVARNLGSSNNHAGLIITVLGDDKEYLFSTSKDWLFKERLLCESKNNVGENAYIVGHLGRTNIWVWNLGTEIFSPQAKWIWNKPLSGTWHPGAVDNIFITFRFEFCYAKSDRTAKLFVIIDNTTEPKGYIKFNNVVIQNDRDGNNHWTGGYGAVCSQQDKQKIMGGGTPACNIKYGTISLKKGKNTIEVKCRNLPPNGNPAGFIISCFDNENNNIFNTTKDWKVISTENYNPFSDTDQYTNFNRDSRQRHVGGHFKYLDRHNVDCGNENGLNYFRLQRGNPPNYNLFRYNYKCKSNPLMTGKPSYNKTTHWNRMGGGAWGGRSGGIENLKYHRMHCPQGVISQFKLQSEDGRNDGRVRYNYRCKDIPTKNCEVEYLPLKYNGAGNPIFLDRQSVGCPGNKMMKSIKYKTNGTKSRYIVQCCDLHFPDDGTTVKDNGITTGFENLAPVYNIRAYQHSNFNGWVWKGDLGIHNLTGKYNDNISSLKVDQGYKAVLYEHSNRTGHRVTFGPGNYNWIPNQGFPNDKASSIEVIKI